MRAVLSCLCLVALSLTLYSGCGRDTSGPAQPAADLNEIQQFLQDNPDQDVDGLEEEPEDDLTG